MSGLRAGTGNSGVRRDARTSAPGRRRGVVAARWALREAAAEPGKLSQGKSRPARGFYRGGLETVRAIALSSLAPRRGARGARRVAERSSTPANSPWGAARAQNRWLSVGAIAFGARDHARRSSRYSLSARWASPRCIALSKGPSRLRLPRLLHASVETARTLPGDILIVFVPEFWRSFPHARAPRDSWEWSRTFWLVLVCLASPV